MTIATATTTARFTKLSDGSWGIRITGELPTQGTTVTVAKADGSTTVVFVGSTITSVDFVHIVRCVSAPRTITTARPITYAGQRARMIRGCSDCARQGKMCWTCQHDELDN